MAMIESVESGQPLAKGTEELIREFGRTFTAEQVSAAVAHARKSVDGSYARFGLDQSPPGEYERLVLSITRHRLAAIKDNARLGRRSD